MNTKDHIILNLFIINHLVILEFFCNKMIPSDSGLLQAAISVRLVDASQFYEIEQNFLSPSTSYILIEYSPAVGCMFGSCTTSLDL